MTKTEAIVLKTADLGETDRLLTIYSKELGKINILAKGVKKLESKLRCHIEPISCSRLILVEGKSFLILKDATLAEQFLAVRRDLDKAKIAYEIINLVDELIVGEEKDEGIWSLILDTFGKLDVGDSTFNIVADFQDNLLRLLGYDPKQIKDLAEIY